MKTDVIPNLFVVGAPKCGTTSIHHYLSAHPDIFLPKRKEPHFFSTDFHRSSDEFHGQSKYFVLRDKTKYLQLFEEGRDKAIVAEASTSYLYSREAARKIAEFSPDAKIIICLRDPFTLLRSWHSYLNFCLEEDISDFREALDAEEARKKTRIKGLDIPKSTKHPERLFYREFIKLSPQIGRYLEHFDRKDILFVFLEDLQSQPQLVYSQILRFLGVKDLPLDSHEVKNPRAVRRYSLISWAQRDLLAPLSRAKKPVFIKALIPRSLRAYAYKLLAQLRGSLDALNRSEELAKAYQEDPSLELELRRELVAEVNALVDCTGRSDLHGLWGYQNMDTHN